MLLVTQGIEDTMHKNHAAVIAELTEKYLQQIFEKNRLAVEIARAKEEIETQVMNVGAGGTRDEMNRMQAELDGLLSQYEKLVGDKLVLFQEMLGNLREMGRSNESAVCAEEEIARLKTNMDFVKRDILQKRRMVDD